jgi:ribosomal protein S18 acetylase RimI-like enzyme
VIVISVRQAKVEDAEAIQRVARLLSVEGRDLRAAQDRGFFLFVGSLEKYRKKITDSPFCFVAFDDESCIGMLTTITPATLAAMAPGPNRNLFDDHGSFPLLIEQIGVLPEYQGRGVGQSMLDSMVSASNATRLMATIVHWPVCNQRSINFLVNKNGWHLQREVTTEKRVWGFYELRR